MTETDIEIKRRGRPSSYSKRLASEICERIASGETLRAICREEDLPDRRTVFRWIADIEDFRHQWGIAREQGLLALEDEILAIADAEGKYHNCEVNRAKLMIQTRQWLITKLQPKSAVPIASGAEQEKPAEVDDDKNRNLDAALKAWDEGRSGSTPAYRPPFDAERDTPPRILRRPKDKLPEEIT